MFHVSRLFWIRLTDFIITLYNVCAVPRGVFSTMGDIMINIGGYLEYRGVFSTVRGYHEYRGGLS